MFCHKLEIRRPLEYAKNFLKVVSTKVLNIVCIAVFTPLFVFLRQCPIPLTKNR